MTKTEKSLVGAIKGGNKEEALELFKAFTELKSSTDEQSNAYYEQIEAIGEEVEEEVEEVTETVEETVVEVEEEVVEAAPIKVREKRGKKAKTIERQEIEKDFNALLEKVINYQAQIRRDRSGDAKLTHQLVKQLRIIKKRNFR